jgi:hypothetical protein
MPKGPRKGGDPPLPATFSERLFDRARKVHLDAGQTLFWSETPAMGAIGSTKVS